MKRLILQIIILSAGLSTINRSSVRDINVVGDMNVGERGSSG